jgi:hypothetical protein
MTQERFARQMREVASGNDAFAVKTASATLALYEQQVRVDTTDGAVSITLPSVAEAKGLMFSIILETDGGTDLTIQDADDSYNWADLTCDDALDGYLLYSDGHVWWQLAAIAA